MDLKYSGLQLNNTTWDYSNKQADYYNFDEELGKKYGLLYNFKAIEYLNNNRSTLTEGWKVPTKSDYETLISFAGGTDTAGSKLRAVGEWNNQSTSDTNSLKFSALPGGEGYNDGNNNAAFEDMGLSGYFNTITPYSSNTQYQNEAIWITNSPVIYFQPGKNYPFSVRLIRETVTVSITNNTSGLVTTSSTHTLPSGDVTIPLTFNDGSDPSCVSSSRGTVTSAGVVITGLTSNTTITLTSTKAQVNVVNGFSDGIDSISPTRQYAAPGTDATFTITYKSGYSDSNVTTNAGTISGSTLTVSVPSGSTSTITATLSEKSATTTVEIGGRSYGTTKIGNQIWMTENLDFKFDGLTVSQEFSAGSPIAYYYDFDEATYGENGNKYGLLYNGQAVKYLEEHKAELLPSGWHVPTKDEWDTLVTTAGGTSVAGTKLKSTTGWQYDENNGTDDFGFAAFPCGTAYASMFAYLGDIAYFSSITEFSEKGIYSFEINYDGTVEWDKPYWVVGQSVRLVKDAQ